ncbi:thioredoxin family protein [Candidatus Hodarchaeum mangrovi]
MTEPDPELQAILNKKAMTLQENATFFKKINQMGVTHVNDGNIDNIIKSSPLPVLVDFSADEWCNPCKVMAPIYETLSYEFRNKVVFLKINTDHNRYTPEGTQIFSVPTFMMFYKGKYVAHRVGAVSQAKFREWIEEVLLRKCTN